MEDQDFPAGPAGRGVFLEPKSFKRFV